jgi:4-hydroxybenzoate polyprenyltransferase
MVGIKSTARKFGGRVKLGVGICYTAFVSAILLSSGVLVARHMEKGSEWYALSYLEFPIYFAPVFLHLLWQLRSFEPKDTKLSLFLFKSNGLTACLLIIALALLHWKTETAYSPNFILPEID